MLVLWRLFGLLVRERSVLKLVGANLKDGQNVLVGVGRRHRRGRRRWRWRSRAADGVGPIGNKQHDGTGALPPLRRGCQSAMSHVIPLRVVQILNSYRWNCNVFGWSRKVTEGNYVRSLSGPGLPPSGIAARSSGPSGALRTSAACAYGRPTPQDLTAGRGVRVGDLAALGAFSRNAPGASWFLMTQLPRSMAAAVARVTRVPKA